MSAFIVEKKTIDRIVTELATDREGQHYLAKIGELLNTDINTRQKWTYTLGQALWDMNVDAVDARYNEANKPLVYTFNFQVTRTLQAIKSLRCFLCQCSEGNVPERPLFKLMESYSRHLMYKVISDMPEYDQADWG